MADTLTDNLGLTKISRRKGWADAMNENLEKIGALHYYHTDGWMFICKNAVCNESEWTQPDITLQSSVIALGNDGSFTLHTCAAGNPMITSWTTVATFGSDGSLTLPGGATISGATSIGGSLSVVDAVRCPTIATEEIYGLLGTVAATSSDVRAEASYTETYGVGTPITIPSHYIEGQIFTVLATVQTSGFRTNHYNSLYCRRIRAGVTTDMIIVTYYTQFSGTHTWTPSAGTIQGGDIICLIGEYNNIYNEFVRHSKIQVCCDDRILTSTLHGDWANFT